MKGGELAVLYRNHPYSPGIGGKTVAIHLGERVEVWTKCKGEGDERYLTFSKDSFTGVGTHEAFAVSYPAFFLARLQHEVGARIQAAQAGQQRAPECTTVRSSK